MKTKMLFATSLIILIFTTSAFSGDYTDGQGKEYYYPKNCGVDQNAYINGRTLCTDVKVKNWTFKQALNPPDYVFDRNYPLLPITAVKDSIDRNSHLPGVPSAKAIQDTGIGMAEFSLTLLKKVEELTLYAIERDKRIKEQQKTIEEWNKTIEEMEKKVEGLEKEVR